MVHALQASLVCIFPILLQTLVYAQQEPLAGSHRSQAISQNNLNFTSLFAPAAFINSKSGPAAAWSKSSWNGLTTFAGATPLRCFGGDEAIPYDVAVLGMFSASMECSRA
jgi:agmatinase